MLLMAGDKEPYSNNDYTACHDYVYTEAKGSIGFRIPKMLI